MIYLLLLLAGCEEDSPPTTDAYTTPQAAGPYDRCDDIVDGCEYDECRCDGYFCDSGYGHAPYCSDDPCDDGYGWCE